MWLHAGIWHLVSNMFAVAIFGPMLERVWGAKRFLIFYLVTGIGAGILYGVADAIEKGNIKSDMEVFVADPNPDDFYIYVHNHAKNMNIVMLTDFADEYFENSSVNAYESRAVLYAEQIYEARTRGLMIGASGAVFAVLLAFAMMFPNTELMLLFPPIPIKAKYLVFFYGAYELYSEINRAGGDNISHITHLSGMVIAFVVLKIWQKQRGDFY
jgi:membrane associated rhomboid family serine protease